MKPLEGVKVVEFTTNLAAPTVGRNLADWGAEVIKVETPKGDVWRSNGPAQECPLVPNVANPVFDNENLNKRWVSVDTRQEAGKQILHTLLKDAAIFLTNYRTDMLKKMGFDYDTLKQRYPSLIYAQILGYGAKGPDAWKPGYDYTVFFARSGFMADSSPAGGPPANAFTGLGDHVTSACLTGGILAALYRRTLTGEGDYVTSSLLQAACFVLGTPLMTGFYGTSLYKTRYQAKQPFSNTFQGSDGEWLYLAAPNYDRDFAKCCALVGRPELAVDPRFATLADAKKNLSIIVPLLDEAFQAKTRDEWVEIFERADLPCERLQHVDQLTKDPQVIENGYARFYTYSNGIKAVASGAPATFASMEQEPSQPRCSGPVGMDNDEILGRYYSKERLDEMRSAGIIA